MQHVFYLSTNSDDSWLCDDMMLCRWRTAVWWLPGLTPQDSSHSQHSQPTAAVADAQCMQLAAAAAAAAVAQHP
jgi:hypothetical protein